MTPEANGTRVYVIEDAAGWCKIGLSRDPEGRLRALQTGNPRPLRLAYVTQPFTRDDAALLEYVAHLGFAKHRVNGEWFACRAETVEAGLKGAVAASQ
jgi:hypothetical protein